KEYLLFCRVFLCDQILAMKVQLCLLVVIFASVSLVSVQCKKLHRHHHDHANLHQQMLHHHSKMHRRDSNNGVYADFECPTPSGYFPHANCWQFWQCGNGIAYEMTCAPGTQWDQSILTCIHLTPACNRPVESPSTAEP